MNLLVKMGQHLTVSILSILGTALAWKSRKESKGEFLSGNRTRTGQKNTLKARLEPMSRSLLLISILRLISTCLSPPPLLLHQETPANSAYSASDCFELHRRWLVRKRKKPLTQIQSGSGQSMTMKSRKEAPSSPGASRQTVVTIR